MHILLWGWEGTRTEKEIKNGKIVQEEKKKL